MLPCAHACIQHPNTKLKAACALVSLADDGEYSRTPIWRHMCLRVASPCQDPCQDAPERGRLHALLPSTVKWELHPVGIIIKSHDPPRGIRFELNRCHWESEPGVFARLPERVVGEIEQWRLKSDGKLHIQWESDGSNSDEWLSSLLKPSKALQLTCAHP